MTELSEQLRDYVDAIVGERTPMPAVDRNSVPPTRRGGRRALVAALVGVLAVAVAGVALVRATSSSDTIPTAAQTRGAQIGQHWDSYFGVDVCGEWLTSPVQFEKPASAPRQRENVGIHSHGDGMIHLHPFVASEAGRNATVGKYFEYGGWTLDDSTLDLAPAGTAHIPWEGPSADRTQTRWQTGDYCTFGPARGIGMTLTWTVDGVVQTGDPSDHLPMAGETIAVYLLPKGAPLPFPPEACAALSQAADAGGRQAPSPGSPCRERGASSTSTRLAVSTDAVVAGDEFTASVVVDNRSGGPLDLVGCPLPFQVALTSPTHQPSRFWPLCARTTTLEEGVTTFPVVVTTEVSPGRYHAEMFLENSDVPIRAARPVAITVRADTKNR